MAEIFTEGASFEGPYLLNVCFVANETKASSFRIYNRFSTFKRTDKPSFSLKVCLVRSFLFFASSLLSRSEPRPEHKRLQICNHSISIWEYMQLRIRCSCTVTKNYWEVNLADAAAKSELTHSRPQTTHRSDWSSHLGACHHLPLGEPMTS